MSKTIFRLRRSLPPSTVIPGKPDRAEWREIQIGFLICSSRKALKPHSLRLTRDQFRLDVRRSKALLEDISGVEVRGYRAPTFSVGRRAPWVHAILGEEGFSYSSSVYPVRHDLYGEPKAPRRPFCPQPGLIEFPLTTVRVLGRNWPGSGGGYFRLLPYSLTRWTLQHARRDLQQPLIFYIHPWEIDPEQPRQSEAPRLSRFRHYLNLSRTEERLRWLLRDFRWTRLDHAFSIGQVPPPPQLETWLSSALK
jgi:polysaccharide deacetylase family protein (PEP-CTERM system associated)